MRTPQQIAAMHLEMVLLGRLGGLSTSISIYDRMLSSPESIGRTSLAMAMYEGRDYLAEIREKRRRYARLRLKLATEAQRLGVRLRRMREYRRAARASTIPRRALASPREPTA